VVGYRNHCTIFFNSSMHPRSNYGRKILGLHAVVEYQTAEEANKAVNWICYILTKEEKILSDFVWFAYLIFIIGNGLFFLICHFRSISSIATRDIGFVFVLKVTTISHQNTTAAKVMKIILMKL
jgi:hypothetical protein